MLNSVASSVTTGDSWKQVQTKFWMRFGARDYQKLMAPAQLVESRTTESMVCIAVTDLEAAIKLESDHYRPSLRQIWSAVTGLDADFRFFVRNDKGQELLVKHGEVEAGKKRLPPQTKVFQKVEASKRDVCIEEVIFHHQEITIKACQHYVAKIYGMKVGDLLEKRKFRNVVRPRQVAMYLSKILTGRSLSEISYAFGGWDHTTVLHAIKRVNQLRDEDSDFDAEIQSHIEALERLRNDQVLMLEEGESP